MSVMLQEDVHVCGLSLYEIRWDRNNCWLVKSVSKVLFLCVLLQEDVYVYGLYLDGTGWDRTTVGW